MDRSKLIKKYENLLYKYGEYDIWDDDISPKLPQMSTEEIKKNFLEDKDYYKAREKRLKSL